MLRYSHTPATYRDTLGRAMKAKKRHNLSLKKSRNAPGEAVDNGHGHVRWLLNGTLHRTNGPAQHYRGEDHWMAFGYLHRMGGPARTYRNGYGSWALYGIIIDSWEEYQGVTSCSDADLTMLILKWGVTK
jgi:hypothetical protein